MKHHGTTTKNRGENLKNALFGWGADVKGVADYLPADKLVPAWGGILACAPQLLDNDGSSPRQSSADVLSIFGQQSPAECEYTKIQQYLQAAAAAAAGAGGQSSETDQSNRIIVDVTFPDVIPIAGQGTQSSPLLYFGKSAIQSA